MDEAEIEMINVKTNGTLHAIKSIVFFFRWAEQTNLIIN